MVGMELRQQLKLAQQLVMTPQLQQAIKLLQLSRTELVDMVQQELEENPVLEETAEVLDRGGQDREIPEPKAEITSQPTDREAVSGVNEIVWEKYL
jgi:RNA polymerase sigma-54 factor